MMVEFMDMAKEYGVGVALSLILFPWVYSVDRRARKTEGEVKNVHVGCSIPQGALEEIKAEVDELKNGEHDLEKRFAVVEASLLEIKTDVKSVLDHLIKKGIDS